MVLLSGGCILPPATDTVLVNAKGKAYLHDREIPLPQLSDALCGDRLIIKVSARTPRKAIQTVIAEAMEAGITDIDVRNTNWD